MTDRLTYTGAGETPAPVRDVKTETARETRVIGDYTVEIPTEEECRVAKEALDKAFAPRANLFPSPIGTDCPDAVGQITEPETDSWFLIKNGWIGVLRGKHETGLWQRHDLPGAWPEQDAVALQQWRDKNSYENDLHETRAELHRYRVCLGHHRSQRARLWSEKRLAQVQLEKLRTAINDALDSAEAEGLHLGRGTEELREFYRILTEAVETEAGTGA